LDGFGALDHRIFCSSPCILNLAHGAIERVNSEPSQRLWIAILAIFFWSNGRRIVWRFYWSASLLALLIATVRVVKGDQFLTSPVVSMVSAVCPLHCLLFWRRPGALVSVTVNVVGRDS
jgi:signal transduction histidine kinase